MYLRSTVRHNADGSDVRYFQLAESVWDSDKGCAVARVIYNFGRADGLDEQALRRLAASILRVLPTDEQAAGATVGQEVDQRGCWPYGAVHALRSLWEEIGIDKVMDSKLRAKRTKQPLELALFAMVANRCLEPCSKLHCFEHWVRRRVFLAGSDKLTLQHLYLAMDLLEEHKTELEKAVYFSVADLMSVDVDLIFYDTTSLHFEIDEEDEEQLDRFERDYEPLRKRGKAKNGRDDAPQLVVGLAVTRDGIPVRSWVFPGNTSDVTTVQKVKNDLRGWKLGRCVFVGDAGMNSEENRRKLALGHGKYILATKVRGGDEVTKEVLTRPGRYHEVHDNLRVKEVVVGDGERRQRYVLCHNPDEATRQSRHRNKLVEHLQQELASMRPSADGHTKRMCELLASKRVGRYLREGTNGLVVDWEAVRREEHYDGKWVITSNDDTLTAEDLALGYKQLMRVEECWRQLKTGLRMRPVYHWRPWRIEAHVTISMLALLLERVAEIRTKQPWRHIREHLETIQVVEYDRGASRIQQTTRVKIEPAALLLKLKVPMPAKIHSIKAIDKDEASDRVEFDEEVAPAVG
jgi:transposase